MNKENVPPSSPQGSSPKQQATGSDPFDGLLSGDDGLPSNGQFRVLPKESSVGNSADRGQMNFPGGISQQEIAQERARLEEERIKFLQEKAELEAEVKRIAEVRYSEEKRFAEEAERFNQLRLAEENQLAREKARFAEGNSRFVPQQRPESSLGFSTEAASLVSDSDFLAAEKARLEREAIRSGAARLAGIRSLSEASARLEGRESRLPSEEPTREQKVATERSRLEEEVRRLSEEAKVVQERLLTEEKARLEEDSKFARERQINEQKIRLEEEIRKLEQERLFEIQRLTEERARLEEAAKRAEASRLVEIRKLAEEKTLLEEKAKRTEEARLSEIKSLAEEKVRLEEDTKKAGEEALLAHDRIFSEERSRLEEASKRAHEERVAEIQRIAEDQVRMEEETRRATEEARLAHERKFAEERARLEQEGRRSSEEAKLAYSKRLEEEKERLERELLRVSSKSRPQDRSDFPSSGFSASSNQSSRESFQPNRESFQQSRESLPENIFPPKMFSDVEDLEVERLSDRTSIPQRRENDFSSSYRSTSSVERGRQADPVVPKLEPSAMSQAPIRLTHTKSHPASFRSNQPSAADLYEGKGGMTSSASSPSRTEKDDDDLLDFDSPKEEKPKKKSRWPFFSMFFFLLALIIGAGSVGFSLHKKGKLSLSYLKEKLSPSEKPPQITPVKEAPKAAAPQSKDPLAPENQNAISGRIASVARKFLAAKTNEERLSLCRNPERVKPLMAEYYSRANASLRPATLARTSIPNSIIIAPYVYHKIVCATEEEPNKMLTFFFEVPSDTYAEPKIDWEASVAYGEQDWDLWLDSMDPSVYQFRITVAPEVIPGMGLAAAALPRPYDNPRKYGAVALSYPGSARTFIACFDFTTENGKDFLAFLSKVNSPGGESSCILQIKKAAGNKTAFIEKFVQPGWVIR